MAGATAGGAGPNAGSTSGGTASGGTSMGGSPAATLIKEGEVRLTEEGLTVVSYGGYLNGESFQQEGVLSHNGYQYTAFWNTRRRVVLDRQALPSGAWSTIELTDYTNTADDAHNTISLGICPGDDPVRGRRTIDQRDPSLGDRSESRPHQPGAHGGGRYGKGARALVSHAGCPRERHQFQ